MKYQIVLQHSVEDYGRTCTASIAKYYGHNLAIAALKLVAQLLMIRNHS
jgi:ABC-type bacteriocin/lantibiotic exporter with double-glycine peptidase domain